MKKVIATLLLTLFCSVRLTTDASANITAGNPAAEYFENTVIMPDESEIVMDDGQALLFINGSLVAGYNMIVRNDRIFVPLDLFTEILGVEAKYDDSTKELSVMDNENGIGLAINDRPMEIINTEIYVPLREIMEVLGYTVVYSESFAEPYNYYYDTDMPVSSASTIVRDYKNIIIDKISGEEATASKDDAEANIREKCLEGLANFKKALTQNLTESGEDPGRFDGEIKSIETEINRMLYIGEVSRYYKFTIGPYDILYDKYNGRIFFVIYSSATIIKEADVNDEGLFSPIFIVG